MLFTHPHPLQKLRAQGQGILWAPVWHLKMWYLVANNGGLLSSVEISFLLFKKSMCGDGEEGTKINYTNALFLISSPQPFVPTLWKPLQRKDCWWAQAFLQRNWMPETAVGCIPRTCATNSHSEMLSLPSFLKSLANNLPIITVNLLCYSPPRGKELTISYCKLFLDKILEICLQVNSDFVRWPFKPQEWQEFIFPINIHISARKKVTKVSTIQYCINYHVERNTLYLSPSPVDLSHTSGYCLARK